MFDKYSRMIPRITNATVKTGRPKAVIAGCGRSGTLFTTQVFKAIGLHVGHEGFLKDGICSWYIAEKTRAAIVKEKLKDLNPVYFHLIRDPIKVVNSMWQIENLPHRAGLDFFRRAYPEYNDLSGTPLHVVKWWIVWNKKTRENYPIDKIIKTENLAKEEEIKQICKVMNVDYVKGIHTKVNAIAKNIHTLRPVEKHYLGELGVKNLTFDMLYKLDKTIASELQTFAKEYRYDLHQ